MEILCVIGGIVAVIVLCAVWNHYSRKQQLSAAIDRVWREYPESTQVWEQFQILTQRVLREVGWKEITWTLNKA